VLNYLLNTKANNFPLNRVQYLNLRVHGRSQGRGRFKTGKKKEGASQLLDRQRIISLQSAKFWRWQRLSDPRPKHAMVAVYRLSLKRTG